MTLINFTAEMQREIYDQVFNKDRVWLPEAVAYVQRTRRGYPDDDPRWTDQTSIDHVLYYVTVAKTLSKDATLDDRNILVQVRQYLDNNPCILPEAAPLPPEPTPEPSIVLDILTYDKEKDQYDHVRATPDEHDEYAVNKDQIGIDLEAEMTEAMSAHITSDIDAELIAENLRAEPSPEPPEQLVVADEPSPTPPVVKKATKKKATKKKASKKKATKKKATKKKTTKKKVSKKK